MSNIKVYEIGQRANCHMYACREYAKVAIGNPRFDSNSIHLCKKHAIEMLKALNSKYGEDLAEDVASEKEILSNLFGKALEDLKVGVLKKETVIETCKKLGLEASEEQTKDTLIEKLINHLEGGNKS